MKRMRIQKPRCRRRVVLEDALEAPPRRSYAKSPLLAALDELLTEFDRVVQPAER